ncbi:MAG: DUF115 domain-containing protein [Desulfarculaceae bacterium]
MSAPLDISEDGRCLLGGQTLHPAADPLQSAKDDLKELLQGAGPDDLLVLAGSGLGWHARAVLESKGKPQTVIYEPEAKRLAMMRSLGPSLPGLTIAETREQLVDFLGKRMVYGRLSRVAVYAPHAYYQMAPEVVSTAKELVSQTLSRGQVDKNTRQLKGGLWRQNLAVNFRQILNLPDLTLLAGALAGVPAVIVGAGPSLDQSLPHLRGVRERSLVMAAASGLGPLSGVEVAPHLALALEGKDESRQFQGADMAKTLLAASTSGHPNHFELWPGVKGLFHLDPWVAALAGAGQALPNGGHATSAAFSLAVLWGCDPIILVGQDLAYSKGRIHAEGRPGGEDEQRPPQVSVPAIGGGEAQTSEVMLSYIGWYQEAAAFMKKRFPRTRIINATQAGALLSGFEHEPLPEALANLPSLGDGLESLSQAVTRIPTPRPGPVLQRLAQARIQLRAALADIPAMGLEAVIKKAPANSTVAAALADLPAEAGPAQAEDAVKHMLETIREMAEGLYA